MSFEQYHNDQKQMEIVKINQKIQELLRKKMEIELRTTIIPASGTILADLHNNPEKFHCAVSNRNGKKAINTAIFDSFCKTYMSPSVYDPRRYGIYVPHYDDGFEEALSGTNGGIFNLTTAIYEAQDHGPLIRQLKQSRTRFIVHPGLIGYPTVKYYPETDDWNSIDQSSLTTIDDRKDYFDHLYDLGWAFTLLGFHCNIIKYHLDSRGNLLLTGMNPKLINIDEIDTLAHTWTSEVPSWNIDHNENIVLFVDHKLV